MPNPAEIPRIPLRYIIGGIAAVLWEGALTLAIEKGWAKDVPNLVVSVGLILPIILVVGLAVTHEAVLHRIARTRKVMSLIAFIIVFGCIGAIAWYVIYKLPSGQPKVADTTNAGKGSPPPPSVTPASVAAENISQAVADLRKDIQELRDDFIRSPSLDNAAKVPLLRERMSELSKEQDTLTNQEKEILQEDSISLDSLERARRLYLQKLDIAKRQAELEKPLKEIEKQDAERNRQNQLKASQQQQDLQEQRFAAPYIPIIDQTIADLYDMVRKVSSEPIFSDFTSARPSINGSKILTDGKFLGGENIIRVGSHKEWEFHLSVPGPPQLVGSIPRKHFSFQITAGNASMSITNEYMPMQGNTGRLQISSGDYKDTCPLSECHKSINLALKQLIQNCWNENPLKSIPTQLSPTPNTATSQP